MFNITADIFLTITLILKALTKPSDLFLWNQFLFTHILKKEQDNPSIGLLLCKSKNNVVAEYSLKDISKPIGVSEYKITSSLPDDLEKQLPSVEDIQKRIK